MLGGCFHLVYLHYHSWVNKVGYLRKRQVVGFGEPKEKQLVQIVLASREVKKIGYTDHQKDLALQNADMLFQLPVSHPCN